MKRYCTLFLSLLYLLSSCSNREFHPQEGDLLFQVSEATPMSVAIAEATAQHDSIKYDHVALLAIEEGKAYVLEATSKHGVSRTPWHEFVSSSNLIDGKPGIVVMRLKDQTISISQAISRAKSHLGEKYDWSYLPDNGKMYCSELIYDAFLDKKDTPIFKAKPMNFRNAKGEMPTFWTDLFQKLGEPIPEGVLGTNPNDMAKDSILMEVFRYF